MGHICLRRVQGHFNCLVLTGGLGPSGCIRIQSGKLMTSRSWFSFIILFCSGVILLLKLTLGHFDPLSFYLSLRLYIVHDFELCCLQRPL